MLHFRKMEFDDIATMCKLRLLQLQEEGADASFDLLPDLMGYFQTHLTDQSFLGWVAIEDEEPVATSGMSFCVKPPYYRNPSGKIGILSCMYTLPEFRRRGIARHLLTLAMEGAQNQGCGTVYITASEQGARLYESCGFQRNQNFFQYHFPCTESSNQKE